MYEPEPQPRPHPVALFLFRLVGYIALAVFVLYWTVLFWEFIVRLVGAFVGLDVPHFPSFEPTLGNQ